MSDQENATLVTGAQDLVGNENGSDEVEESGSVKLATHRKLLGQLKKQSDELNELREFRRQTQEDDLAEKGKYQELLKMREEELQRKSDELNQLRQQEVYRQKISAFLSKVPGTVTKTEYLSFADLDSVHIDESGEVDEFSLQKSVDKFVKEHGSDLIRPLSGKGLPNVSSVGKQGAPVKRDLKDLSREELKKLWYQGRFAGD